MEFRLHPEVIHTAESAGARLEVIEFDPQPTESPLESFQQLLSRPARWRQLALQLSGGNAVLEPGALQYLRGEIELQASASGGAGGGLGGLLRGAVTAAATGESLFKTVYHGRGVIYTEPTRLHLLLGALQEEELIVDDGAFVACAGNITVGRHVNRGLAAMLGSGEGRVQPKLSGTGVFALQSPVHPSEFQILELRGETLKVDGNLVLAYTNGLTFSVEKSTRGLLASGRSGEGYVQVYRGTGRVWLAPTLPIHTLAQTLVTSA
ncbi:AIM24 family protein [Deinococcus sp. S9]|uniref:AIM24 family protein n=1 Tax=Deinococcus sp. S9 TaxID=2545754 RepID=UPI001056D21F|nr:AIM24 family protein [Deinococcus sp. S9]TDE86561.1 AIM24 family protein [Deinococcus sp. S9]